MGFDEAANCASLIAAKYNIPIHMNSLNEHLDLIAEIANTADFLANRRGFYLL